MRDELIISFLPHSTHLSKTTEKQQYKQELDSDDGQLETVLYGAIWDDLLLNERLAIAFLYYEDSALVDETTDFYANIHAYVEAKRQGDTVLAKQQLKDALWEILHNSLPDTDNELLRDKAKRRRKAQATLLNSLNISTADIHTPDYIVQPIRQRFDQMTTEELLPEIAFPLKENARRIAEEIQQINAEIQGQLLGNKSIVSESEVMPEASDAFTDLAVDIIENGTRRFIDKELNKLVRQGRNSEQIVDHMQDALQTWQDVTIPDRVEMLALHFNGKLSEIRQREADVTHYVWRSMDDEKVRGSHAENDDRIFAWDEPPSTGHPGEEFNCRCYAEPLTELPRLPSEVDPSGRAEPVYPEALIGGVAALGRIVVGGIARIGVAVGSIFRKPPNPKDVIIPGGKPIGRPGRRPEYREEKGGQKAADELYDKFGRGKPDTPKNYPGEGKRLPNGDWVGKRPKSKSGEPAVDLDVKGVPYRKIKFPKQRKNYE